MRAADVEGEYQEPPRRSKLLLAPKFGGIEHVSMGMNVTEVGSMTVTIELFGVLRKNRDKVYEMEVDSPRSISEIAAMIGLSIDEIGLAVIDGVQIPLTTNVPVTCRLSLFSPMMGG